MVSRKFLFTTTCFPEQDSIPVYLPARITTYTTITIIKRNKSNALCALRYCNKQESVSMLKKNAEVVAAAYKAVIQDGIKLLLDRCFVNISLQLLSTNLVRNFPRYLQLAFPVKIYNNCGKYFIEIFKTDRFVHSFKAVLIW